MAERRHGRADRSPQARLAVYCGSNVGIDERYAADAQALGGLLAERGVGLVYGGGHVGLMGVVADAVLAGGGEVTGVITDRLVGAEIAHPRVTELRVVPSMHERKATMSGLADGVVALPGGYGTLDEVLEVLTWNQLGLLATPVVFLDTGGFFADLFSFFDGAVAAGFVRPAHRGLARRATTAAEAVDLALTPPVAVTAAKWIDRGGTDDR